MPNQTPPSPSPSDADPPPKTVLICPECGHESPIDGDWVKDDPTPEDQRCGYECPDCGAVITRRPAGVADGEA